MNLRKLFLSVVSALAGTMIGLASAGADITVNCGAFPGISDALGMGETVITVNGTCIEDVFVTADDVAILGGVDGGIAGTLTVSGAQRFTVQRMTVNVPESNENEGILVMHGASATIFNTVVTGSSECGILAFMHSFAGVFNSVIDGNGFGLCSSTGSFVRGRNNTITNSVNAGVEIGQNGAYRARDDTIDNTGGGAPAITLSQQSYVDLRPGFVTGDIVATDHSHIRARRSSTIDGDVEVDALSEFVLTQGSSVTGDVSATHLSIVKTTDGAIVDGRIKCKTKSLCLP